MHKFSNLNHFDSIITKIRRRLDMLDQKYKVERTLLLEELEEFIELKLSLIEYISISSGKPFWSGVLGTRTSADANDEISYSEMPWGRYASGVDKVLYVIKQAGAHGLSKREIVDQIEKISSTRPEFNSVTTWLYRAKKRGQIRNVQRRWYIAQ